MSSYRDWLYWLTALAIAVLANSVSAHWAHQHNKFSPWLLATVVIAPIVYITFGLVASRTGLAIAAGTIDLSLALITSVIGLAAFGEWNRVSVPQYVGLGLGLAGVALMLLFPKHE